MKLLASKFNEKKIFLRSQLYARAYMRIWTLRPCCIDGDLIMGTTGPPDVIQL